MGECRARFKQGRERPQLSISHFFRLLLYKLQKNEIIGGKLLCGKLHLKKVPPHLKIVTLWQGIAADYNESTSNIRERKP